MTSPFRAVSRWALTTICIFIGGAQARGEVIFDNLDNPQVGLTAASDGWSAQSFVVSHGPMALDSLDIAILPNIGTGDFTVTLFSNTASNLPGVPLEVLSGATHPFNGIFHYTASGNSLLAANTPYWMVFSSTGGPYAVAGNSFQFYIDVGTTLGFQYSVDSGQNWAPANYTVNMRVTGTQVPEPSSIILLSIAAASVLLVRRRLSHARVN